MKYLDLTGLTYFFNKLKNKIVNSYSTKTDETYSANYINNNVGVVDSGSNANGSYVKFEDGTMICWVNLSRTDIAYPTNYADSGIYIGQYIWNFPTTFLYAPTVTVGRCTYDTGGGWGSPSGASTTSAGVYLYDVVPRSVGGVVNIGLQAIGKWK